MSWIAKLPIRAKLTVISILTSMIAILLAGMIIVTYDNYLYHTQKVSELTAQAKILAASMSAPLEFSDQKTAQDYLAPLSANPEITSGAVYKIDGVLFASYALSNVYAPPSLAEAYGIKRDSNEISIYWPVTQNNQTLGSVYLQASIEPLSTRVFRYLGIFLLAMIASLLVTLPIAMRLHYVIANPVYARSLIEASIDPLVTINPQGEIMDVNLATVKATGLNRETLIGTDFSSYFTDPAKAGEIYQQVFNEGLITDFPLTIRNANGKLIDVLYNAAVYKSERGNVLGVVAVARDVTVQKQAELEIHRRTAELQVANKELEAFSYSVSHDLRAPLRAIDGFSAALLEDYAESLDDIGKSHLTRVRAATQRMGNLIDDMLELSRITRVEMQHETINLSEMVTSVLKELQKNDANRKVDCRVQPDLLGEGDARLMRIVFDNLLGNAWKYTSKKPDPFIEFGAIKGEGGITTYFVRDNGAGFDMTYSGKLFGAFQRLHTVAEFPGTGVGLATVQRIIHRHGGKVYGEGVPNLGATFYFTLTMSPIGGVS